MNKKLTKKAIDALSLKSKSPKLWDSEVSSRLGLAIGVDPARRRVRPGQRRGRDEQKNRQAASSEHGHPRGRAIVAGPSESVRRPRRPARSPPRTPPEVQRIAQVSQEVVRAVSVRPRTVGNGDQKVEWRALPPILR